MGKGSEHRLLLVKMLYLPQEGSTLQVMGSCRVSFHACHIPLVCPIAGSLSRGQPSTSSSSSHLCFPGIRNVSHPSSLWVLTANCLGGCLIPFSFLPNQIKLMKTLNWPCSKT